MLKRERQNGYSLIEVMFALVILSVAILGLASLTTRMVQINQENDLRNMAVQLTTETAERTLGESIDTMVNTTENRDVKVRGVNKRFDIYRTVTSLTTDLRQIDIRVEYSLRGQTMVNRAVIYKHRTM